MDDVPADVNTKSPRIVPGSASWGLVAPIILRAIETTLLPSQTMRKQGPP